MNSLLVVIDMQNDFVSGALGSAAAKQVVPAVAEQIARRRADGAEIVFTRDTHGGDYLHTAEGKKLPVVHCVSGTEGHEIVRELKREAENARVIDKGAFGSVALAQYAKERGFDAIALCGVCTDICVVSNALLLKAFCPEAEIKVIAAACAGTTEENHRAALSVMRSCQIDIE